MPGVLALVCIAGAALRFATLDGQSLWFDEAVTAQLLRMNLPDMLSAIPDSESTPPLYYVLGWVWSQVAGTGEVGLRSLTALLGTATIPVVWALARRLGGDRAALAAAALTAVNPMLVWFSQEARSYALLGLLAAAAALLWLRALEQPRPARLLAWGAVAALALATHYYAIFLVGPQALWLLARAPTLRARAVALALPLVAGAALAPLALAQRSNDSAAFIGESALGRRLAQVVKQFLVGYDAPAEKLLAVASALVLLTAAAGLVALVRGRADVPRRARDEARALTVVAAAAVLVPALLAVAGEDHVVSRNLVAALPLAAALAGAGLSAVTRPAAIAATAVACALALVAVVGVAVTPAFQRDDWRGAASALGPRPAGERIVVTAPGALVPLRYYLPRLRPFGSRPVTSAQIDYLALAPRRGSGRGTPPRPPSDRLLLPGFAVDGRREGETFTVVRTTARRPQPVLAGQLSEGLDRDRSELLRQPSGQT